MVHRSVTFLLVFGAVVFDAVRMESRIHSAARDDARPEVTTAQGIVQGIIGTSRLGRNISTFLGIPYAEPPIGELRFTSPVAKAAWDGVLDASAVGSRCPQLSSNEYIGDENCLYLNVFTPQLPENGTSDLLPVMFYVPGGGFESGGSDTFEVNANYLLDKDVVLVSINYRLGVLGFMSTGDEVSPGNYGLKDQVRALKWTQENIEYFGGDPDRVTIFGQSAGAASVHFLTLSDTTTGLFNQCIMQSGSALAYWAYRPRINYKQQAYQIGEILNCTSDTSTDLIACLRTRNASDIVGTRSVLYEWGMHPIVVWGPTDEVEHDESFLTASPIEIIQSGEGNDVQYIVGATKDDGFSFSLDVYGNSDTLADFLGNASYLLPYILFYKDKVADEVRFTEAIIEYYFNDLTADRDVLAENYTQLISDSLFLYPAYRAVREQSTVSAQPIYFYTFAYRGTFSYTDLFGTTSGESKVTHCDELLYLFDMIEHLFPGTNKSMKPADYQMLDAMIQMWTSFVIEGTPTTSSLISNTTWNPYSSQKDRLLIGNYTDTSLEIVYSLQDRMEFWDQLVAMQTSSSHCLFPTNSILTLLFLYLYLWF